MRHIIVAVSGDVAYGCNYDDGLANGDRLDASGRRVRVASDGYVARYLCLGGSFGSRSG